MALAACGHTENTGADQTTTSEGSTDEIPAKREKAEEKMTDDAAAELLQGMLGEVDSKMQKVQEDNAEWFDQDWALDQENDGEEFQHALGVVTNALSEVMTESALDQFAEGYTRIYFCSCDAYAPLSVRDALIRTEVAEQSPDHLQLTSIRLGDELSRSKGWTNVWELQKEDGEWKLDKHDTLSTAEAPLSLTYDDLKNGFIDYETGERAKVALVDELEIDGEPYIVIQHANSDLMEAYHKHHGSHRILEQQVKETSSAQQANGEAYISTEDEASPWTGEWHCNEKHYEGTLSIFNTTTDSFDFTIITAAGQKLATTEGTADISGEKATYYDPGYDCTLDMTREDGKIDVEATEGCSMLGGMGATLAGTFDDEWIEQETTLAEMDILKPEDDEKVRALTGIHYEIFIDNMMTLSEGENLDAWDAHVVQGFVPGMAPDAAAIIMISEQGEIYAATTVNQERIIYFTTDEAHSEQLPQTIHEWTESKADKPVEMWYKEI